MATITLKWDKKDIAFWKERRLLGALESALKAAGNRAIRDMKSASQKGVRAKKKFKVKSVNQSLLVIKPKSKKIDRLVWHMRVSGVPIRLGKLPHSQTKRGVSVAINKGKRTVIKGAFIATMSNRHEGVFRRRGKERLKIDELVATRVSDVFQNSGFIPEVQMKAQQTFTSSFQYLMGKELDKARSRRG